MHWEDSVTWERSPELFKRQWADVMRHSENLVIFSVAILCGGYEHLMELSNPWRAMLYVCHKDKYPTEAKELYERQPS